MASLVERMRRSRERWLERGSKSYLLRRPTLTNLMQWSGNNGEDLVRRCLVGWRGFVEADLVPSGSSEECAFELEAAIEWLMDRPEDMAAIADELRARVLAFVAEQKEDEKN